MREELLTQLQNASKAAIAFKTVDTDTKNIALHEISKSLLENIDAILVENKKDIDHAKENGITDAMVDRLKLDENRITSIAESVESLVTLHDPVGEVIRTIHRPNGLLIEQIRVPMGVYGIIYESRPNVTVDIASLCIKSSNVALLKGGKEAIYTNTILTSIIQDAIQGILPENTVQLITGGREDVLDLITANDYVDVVVPRGGKGLIQHVVKNATVPVIETGAGNCHLYIDKYADLKKAIDISINAKIQRPSVCNAIETILVHKDIAKEYLPEMAEAFKDKVEIRGDTITQSIIDCLPATNVDYATEYDDYIVSVKVVDSIQEAIAHIYKYSTKHSECIVTENKENAELFMNALDSACVYHNASTRFSDGGEFGFGAELGISTQKLHARGPLGLLEMCSFQYKVYGNGQVRK